MPQDMVVAIGRMVVASMLGVAFIFAPAPHVATQDGVGSLGVTRFVVDRIESPTFEGRSFGAVGQYEKIVGRAFGELDPGDPLNAAIVNLDRAPRNGRGMVEYDVDVYILKPIDMGQGNATLLYGIVNRGNKLPPNFNRGGGGNDPTLAQQAGDGFVMERGFTLAWSGWQGDVAPGGNRLGARLPIATEPDGSPIRRWIRSEFVFDASAYSARVSFNRDGLDEQLYPAVEETMTLARLSRRSGPDAPEEAIPRDQWSFGRCPDGTAPIASTTDVCYPAGFSTDYIYDLEYEAQDPVIMGIGFAATRDVVSFLRYDHSPKNPLMRGQSEFTQPAVQWSISTFQFHPPGSASGLRRRNG